MKAIICKDCGATALKTGPVQKYCRSCSVKHDLERKRRWGAKNPPSPEQVSEYARRRKRMQQLIGAARSLETKANIAWMNDAPDLLWLVRVSIPFTYSLSKNAIWRMGSQGHIHLREDANAARTGVTNVFRKALNGFRVARNKLWVDLFIQKPDHKGDAANFVDTIFDSIKKAVGLDDRWFSLRRLDWQVTKNDPRIFIGIGQDSRDDVQCCSMCGGLYTFDRFGKNKSNELGIGRLCNECRLTSRRLKREDASLSGPHATKEIDTSDPRVVVTIQAKEPA